MDWRKWLDERDIPYIDEGERLIVIERNQMTEAQLASMREIFTLPIDEIVPHLTSEWRGDSCHTVFVVEGSAGVAVE